VNGRGHRSYRHVADTHGEGASPDLDSSLLRPGSTGCRTGACKKVRLISSAPWTRRMTAIQGRVSARASAHGKSISGAGRRQWRHQRSAFCPSLFSPLLPTFLSIFLLFLLCLSLSREETYLPWRCQAVGPSSISASKRFQARIDPVAAICRRRRTRGCCGRNYLLRDATACTVISASERRTGRSAAFPTCVAISALRCRRLLPPLLRVAAATSTAARRRRSESTPSRSQVRQPSSVVYIVLSAPPPTVLRPSGFPFFAVVAIAIIIPLRKEKDNWIR